MDTTRTAPITTTYRDFLVSAWVAPRTAAEQPDSALKWTIEVGGREYSGPGVDPATHGSVSQVRDMLRAWAKEHPELFV